VELVLSRKKLQNYSRKAVGEEHVEDLLGPARPPRMPMNLVERRHRTTEQKVEERELGQRGDILCF
jgi:hypothetical protein